jgi:hypothetical protein
MAHEKDDVDSGLLATIGLAGSFLVLAGAYYAAGIYWEYRAQEEVSRNVQPEIERVQALRDAQLTSLQNGPLPITDAMRRVAEQKR